jgi:hypothetical protein
MSKNTNANENVTVEDVVAKAAEQKLVTPTVPAQGDNKDSEQPKLTVVEEVEGDEKKSLKDRLEALTEQIKKNKKTLIGVGAAVAVATIAFAKLAKQKATEVIETVADDESEVDEDGVIDYQTQA